VTLLREVGLQHIASDNNNNKTNKNIILELICKNTSEARAQETFTVVRTRPSNCTRPKCLMEMVTMVCFKLNLIN